MENKNFKHDFSFYSYFSPNKGLSFYFHINLLIQFKKQEAHGPHCSQEKTVQINKHQ